MFLRLGNIIILRISYFTAPLCEVHPCEINNIVIPWVCNSAIIFIADAVFYIRDKNSGNYLKRPLTLVPSRSIHKNTFLIIHV